MVQSPNKRLVTEATLYELVAAMLLEGSGLNAVYDEEAGTYTISTTGLAPAVHTHTASQISDSSATGRSVVTAASAALARSAIGAAQDTHTHLASNITDFTESVQDVVGAFLSSGTGISVTYDDAGNVVSITAIGGGGEWDSELTRDTIGTALLGTGLISVGVNDAGDTITISTTATANAADSALRDRTTHTGFQLAATISDLTETVQDLVAGALLAGTDIGVVYDDALGKITLSYTGAALGVEGVRDTIGAVITAGTGVNVVVDDAANTVTLSLAAHTHVSTDISDLAETIRDRMASTLVAGSGITVTHDDAGDTITIAATGGGGGGGTPAQIDNYLTEMSYWEDPGFEWVKPVGAKTVRITCVGGGGGGGSGRKGASSSNRAGGGGGGAGGVSTLEVAAADLPDTLRIAVGPGGQYATGNTTDSSNGGAGQPGYPSMVFVGVWDNEEEEWGLDYTILVAGGGLGGLGGTNTTGVAGGRGGDGTDPAMKIRGLYGENGQGASSVVGSMGTYGAHTGHNGGGGAGGGVDTSNQAAVGGGSNSRGGANLYSESDADVYYQGVAGAAGRHGNTSWDASQPVRPGPGGSGSSGRSAGGIAGNGGNGFRGGGGGGGGAATNGGGVANQSGGGGTGGTGYVQIVTTF